MKYPTAISLLLPVVSTIQPNLLESAISVVPRMRLCRFSSVRSGALSANASAVISRYALNAGSMATVR
ncbi:unannotated protein [freshwater metagenome]|uniref:Unannotated protein n=1 Tax=freshwater metagenome TaxID=449393 RepID=A0A6J7C6D9_9ZZZZ